MTRPIDAYKVRCERDDFDTYADYITAFDAINEAPTIDVVPVIKCKDCKYYKDDDCWYEWDNDGQIYYQSIINEPNPDDYCSRAKRKEE